MKKLTFIILLFSAGFHLQAQEPLEYMLKKYFRVHPFETRFSTFITNLQQDPWFNMEHYIRRTDTNFFFLSGTYTNFNPFGFPAKEVRLIVAENEYIYNDSLNTIDTIINLQMMGITDTGSMNIKPVIREFNRFHNKSVDHFFRAACQPITSSGAETGSYCDYYIYPVGTPTVTAVWGKLENTDLLTFTILIRCRVSENSARFYLGRDF